MQFCVAVSMLGFSGSGSESNCAPPGALCEVWHERQAFSFTVPYGHHSLGVLGNFVRRRSMDAFFPVSKSIVLTAAASVACERAVGSCGGNRRAGICRGSTYRADLVRLRNVARQAHRGVGIVHDQEIQLHRIDAFHVRVMAGIALHVSADQLHCRISRCPAAYN